MNIGEIIKSHRQKQSLSMNGLARLSGVGQSGLSEIEAGKRQPTFDVLERIVKALQLTFSEFFSKETPELDPELRRLLDTAKDFTPEQLEILNKFLQTMKGE